MKIIEYADKYLEDVKDLLVELEEYIIAIDEDNLDKIDKDYRDKMAIKDLESAKNNDGKCYLCVENDKVLGFIIGEVYKYSEDDYLDYKCPKKGDITELIISKEARKKGVGTLLMQKMEDYFKSIGCEYINVSVFAYNKNAIEFYKNKGYHTRMLDMIKKI